VIRGLALGALLAAWLVAGLVGHDPWKPDEAYTFGLVYHILQHNDWLVPTLAGEPFVEKPPLFYWTAALFANALGPVLPLHDAARLASAFYAALTLAFTYLIAKDWCESPIAAPLLLAGCLGYLQHAHQLITDNALLAGIALGLYGLARSSAAAWHGRSIAFLSKGLLARHARADRDPAAAFPRMAHARLSAQPAHCPGCVSAVGADLAVAPLPGVTRAVPRMVLGQ